MLAHHLGVKRQRRLRHRGQSQCLRRQHEARDVAAAIDRAVDAECLIGMNDGDVRRAEEIEILQCLLGVGRLVAARDAQRIVKLKAAFAASLQIDAAIFARERKVSGARLAARGGAVHRIAKFFRGSAGGDRQLPGLAVAPRRGFLRRRQYALDGGARHRLRQERAARIPFAQQFLQHADPFFGAIPAGRHFRCSIRHAHRPLVGILLNGTSLSTRMSPGRPSTRSAMMLRRISSVPPAMRIDGELSSICWNWPRGSSSAAPGRTPAAPSRSIAYIAMSCSIEPATSLPIEFSGPGRSPFDSAEIARMLVYFNPLALTAQLASLERTLRSSIARPSSSIRLLHSSNSSGKPVATPAPIDIRSFISVVSDTFQPSLTSPSRCASGICTSVKYTSLNSDCPLAWLVGFVWIPVFVTFP